MCCHPLLKGLREYFHHPLVKKRLGSSITTGRERQAPVSGLKEGGILENQTNDDNSDLQSVMDTWANATGLTRTEANPFTMSAIWNLHCLYTLDPSFPDFLRRLYSLFCYDDEERHLSRLQGPELTRLLDFLDRVCTLRSAFRPTTNKPCRLSARYLSTTMFI